jgi:hypothetical protein
VGNDRQEVLFQPFFSTTIGHVTKYEEPPLPPPEEVGAFLPELFFPHFPHERHGGGFPARQNLLPSGASLKRPRGIVHRFTEKSPGETQEADAGSIDQRHAPRLIRQKGAVGHFTHQGGQGFFFLQNSREKASVFDGHRGLGRKDFKRTSVQRRERPPALFVNPLQDAQQAPW